MLQTTRGIVFHHLKYSDTSVIAKIYTEESGLQSYIVKGVRSRKSRGKMGTLQPLSLVELVAYQKKSGGLHHMKEIRLSHPFTSIPFDILKSTMVLFLTEVLYKTIKEESANPPLFNYLSSAIQVLDLEEECVNFHLYFLTHLTKFLGFYPQECTLDNPQFFDLEEAVFTLEKPLHSNILGPQECKGFRAILGTNFDGIKRLQIGNSTRRELLNGIISYFRLHLEGMKDINAHEVLETVLND
jgi:DNA repair protein RecO (recombination protein O)